MKIRYPQMGIALAVAALLAGTCAVSAYAVPETETAGTSTAVTDTTTAANESDDTLWKAEISDYDSSLSLVQYEEVTPSEEQAAAIQNATTLKEVTVPIGSSGTEGSANGGAAASMAACVSAGQVAFTTYGYGHGCGLSQNGANFYATYGGYDYQAILFHYYPGTTLMQVDIPNSVTAGGRTGSVLDIISMLVYNEMGSTMAPEAMKAQAVAAFTYVMNPKANNNSLICKDNPPQNVIDAVQSVLGQALYYNGDYALTVYSASSGGYTAAASDVFGVNYDYLISVPCEYDAEYDPHYGTVVYFSEAEIRSRLQSAYNITLSDNPANWISLEIGGGGYISHVTIDGQKTVTGESLRSVLGLKSDRYNYAIG